MSLPAITNIDATPACHIYLAIIVVKKYTLCSEEVRKCSEEVKNEVDVGRPQM
jgi:hypothetical protein